MAYVMLVVGALMAVAGAYAAITGYSIIQVEQGWATVIAGASLTAGGIVTIAIALVLRTLQSLHKMLAEPREAVVVAEQRVEHRATSSLDLSARTPDADPAPPLPPHPEEPIISTAESDRDMLFGAPPTGDDYKLETPSTAEHDLLPADPPPRPARTPSKSVPADDWLDRAFAEFDQEVSEPPPAPRPQLSEQRTVLEPEIRREPEPGPIPELKHEPLPPAVAAATEPAAEETSAAVIGRYEADGTSYVMYADGSIEAQTYSGVYRFASMAELKAFIES